MDRMNGRGPLWADDPACAEPEGGTRARVLRLYEAGRRYNNALGDGYYRLVNTNTEFYAGNQWKGLPQTPEMQKLPKPVFNILRRITGVLVAQITNGGLSVNLEPLSYYDGGPGDSEGFSATEFAQAEINNLLEKLGLEYRVRDALFEGARTGDYCAHFFWDPYARPYGGASGSYRGEICMELIDGVNVMFGNPNTPQVELQPYILLVSRETVNSLRAEYLQEHPGDLEGARRIRADSEWEDQASSAGKLELTGDESAKCLCLYLYEKRLPEDPAAEEPLVYITKCTRTATIFEAAETGLQRYPIAWGNWEREKNSYHGRALVTGLLSNQTFINSMLAMMMQHLQLESFPKIAYNADLISRWDNAIGSAIAVHGLEPGQPVQQAAAAIQPADMSAQNISIVEKVVELTRECVGVTDVQMGTERADNTSAIMVVQQNAEVPLDNIRSGVYEWVESITAILLDMLSTYYGRRPIVRTRSMEVICTDQTTGTPLLDPATGMLQTSCTERRVLEPFDFSTLRSVWLSARVDVGSSTAYSEIAMTQTLDNLRDAELITLEEYLERIPDKLIPRKQEIIDRHRRDRLQQSGVAAGQAFGWNAGGGAGADMNATAGMAGMTGAGMTENAGNAGNAGSTGNPEKPGKTGKTKKTGSRHTVTRFLFDKALDTAKVPATLPGSMQTTFSRLPTATRNTLAKNASTRI